MQRLNHKSIVLILLVALTSESCTNSYLGRWFIWNKSDVYDYEKFPSHNFKASDAPFVFPRNPDNKYDTFSVSEKGTHKLPLLDLLKANHTTAFLVIRNDSILYERYLNGYDEQSTNTSFSTAKSITSLLVGRAIADGFIASERDAVSVYLPELLETDTAYASVTISDVLDMRSGIQFKDHDLPWGDKPKAYYHPKLRERIRELPITTPPGTQFKYNSYNPIVAGMILEKATGSSPAHYFERTIWDELGMQYAGSWSMDSEESKMTKMESGLNLTAIDFAKLGRLVLHQGNWNGKQVVPEQWINACMAINSEHHLKEFGDEIYYENFWWLYSKDKKTAYIVSAWGHLGQYLYIFPEKNLIIVRMGKKTGKVESWGNIFKEIAGYR